jgi:gliding motility-associated-like protein
VFFSAQSQPVLCPPNLDFEAGNFSFWECRTGHVSVASGQNEVLWEEVGQVPDRHMLIPHTDLSLDFYGGFPRKCPNGSLFSIKLGNDLTGNEAEAVAYSFDIPATATNFSLLYNYAIVMQDPDHPDEEQPRFRARVVDAQTGEVINCVTFDFKASSSLPGFQFSSVSPNVVYKNWTPISVNLSAYAGRTIMLEFITSDCTRGGHFGYAYFDVNSSCDGTIAGSALCLGEPSMTLTAPLGFQSYLWFSNTTFSTPISSAQSMTFNPPPTANSVFPVILNPYPGFGCVDTVYATIAAAAKPPSVAGPDATTCSKVPIQLGGTPNPQYSYSWSPANYLQNPFIANPFTQTNMTGPVNFVLKTTDMFTKCFSYDTVRVIPTVVDTSATVSGKLIYCPGETLNTTLRLNNTSATVQWYQNSSAISGATSLTYQPQNSNNNTYWAELKQNGCTDTSRSFRVYNSTVPVAEFQTEKILCVGKPASFTNKSTIAGNEQLSYEWEFSDGVILNGKNITRTFTTPGNYSLTLTAKTPGGCFDEERKDITVTDDCGVYIPTGFTPNGDGLNDLLTPLLSGVKTFKRFSIYNRYGNMMYSTNSAGEGWDGRYMGVLQPTGVFVWLLEYVNKNDQPITLRGVVSLIR